MVSLRDLLDNLGGAALIAANLILQPITRARYRRWGATDDEGQRPLPGDERIPRPRTRQTLAVTIHAPAAEVYPWIAQIGQERGGLYSYELLENLVGCKIHNADHIAPEWEMQVGDLMRMGPPGYPVDVVVGLERGRWLLMAGADPQTGEAPPLPAPDPNKYVNATWLLYLDEQPDGRTRLISRSLVDYAPRSFANKLIWEVFTDPIGFVMTRKMLLGVKARAERARR